MTHSDLKQKTIRGFVWSSLESILSQGLGIVIGIVLARILSPDDFGLVGMVTIFISVSQVFVDSGLSLSVIRKQNCTQADYSTVFWINFMIGAACYLIIWITAPFIADFYGKPQLIPLTRIISLSIIITSFTLVQQTMLTKNVDFKILTKSSVAGTLISGAVAVWLACKGFGAWSLVWRTVINQAVRSAVLWSHNRWKPDFTCSRKAFAEHFSFGSNILLIYTISSVYKNISYLIIGKTYAEKILGYYTNSDQYSTMFSTAISNITNRVSYPVMSAIQDDRERLVAAVRKIMANVMYASFVAMFGLAAVAKPLIETVLGEKWMPAAIIFQVLCLAYSTNPMHIINQNIMKVMGRTDLFLKSEIIKHVMMTPFLILGIFYGLEVIIAGIVAFYWGGFLIMAMYSKQLVGYSTISQLCDMFPLFAVSFVPAVAVVAFGELVNMPPLLLLFIQGTSYISLTLLFSIIFKLPAFHEIKNIISDRLAYR
ncbi:MAG: lipopolysaccharide biosynthesis protein [Bacteroidales bacterium]|nr:lipopolysaccharide biosynthesis protein [Bacteroidales bacterium]